MGVVVEKLLKFNIKLFFFWARECPQRAPRIYSKTKLNAIKIHEMSKILKNRFCCDPKSHS